MTFFCSRQSNFKVVDFIHLSRALFSSTILAKLRDAIQYTKVMTNFQMNVMKAMISENRRTLLSTLAPEPASELISSQRYQNQSAS